ncbi:hypothetical protein C1T17_00815 [Sphingobium sp. SCG-1]|uniref:hypothetical protein n=1 Tax=Sphingobium sp. SCG-1 TaxID=2072936 RepID=UPI000CD6C4C8|nr:hypothetical protein [Sphingobium sp. SCG-1]AUW56832.1 hypothetical protein C1T17_00815 [Sphingobium sp. SCG-1]
MGIFTKAAATIIGTRIAADTGKSGFLGVAAGMLATRVIARSPIGALLVGGTYVAHKLLQKKREVDALGPHGAAVKDGLATPSVTLLPESEPTGEAPAIVNSDGSPMEKGRRKKAQPAP